MNNVRGEGGEGGCSPVIFTRIFFFVMI
jgi:hypothetical protein